jgi:hypothetical protein
MRKTGKVNEENRVNLVTTICDDQVDTVYLGIAPCGVSAEYLRILTGWGLAGKTL